MPKGVDLSAAVKARLEQMAPARGYHTELRAVYDDGSVGDNKPMPFALLDWAEDSAPDPEKRMLTQMQRVRQYQVVGVFPAKTPGADLERFAWDCVRALSSLGDEFSRPLPGQLKGDTASIMPIGEGSQLRRVVVTIEIHYVETYA